MSDASDAAVAYELQARKLQREVDRLREENEQLNASIHQARSDEGKGVIKPSHFTVFPCSSLLGKSEAETVAQNIMVVCARRGDRWGELTREDYQTEREKDGDFTVMELSYFDQVYPLINSLTGARAFASVWAKVSDENRG